MRREDKQLLLKDLCARLPHGVVCYAFQFKIDGNHCECRGKLTGINNGYFYLSDREPVNGGKTYDESYLEVKPYLRSMSSMTEEEKKEVHYFVESHKLGSCSRSGAISDYLNSIHIDYRGLIEKGLALEAPEGMYSKN